MFLAGVVPGITKLSKKGTFSNAGLMIPYCNFSKLAGLTFQTSPNIFSCLLPPSL